MANRERKRCVTEVRVEKEEEETKMNSQMKMSRKMMTSRKGKRKRIRREALNIRR